MNINLIYPNYVPEYIGLKIENGEYQFIFPRNYQSADTEESLRKDILNILYVIEKYKTLKSIHDSHQQKYSFPLHSYIWIIQDYLENGYYQVDKIRYIKSNNGKINWNRTIKNNNLFPDRNNIIYKEFIVRKNQSNIENMITLIHKFCVYEAVSQLGWLYHLNVNIVEKPVLNLSFKQSMLFLLKNEYTRSFKDSKKNLILNMIQMLEGLDSNKMNLRNFELSTNEFEYVFETLVDESFGNMDSSNYNPYALWYLNEKGTFKTSELRPDTILIKNNIAYVIDAKYYQYGYTMDPRDLPGIGSIHKQITYTEDLDLQHKELDKIYNIFLLPKSTNDSFDDSYIEYIGYSDTSWKDGKKSYEKVYTFLIDLKRLLNRCYTKEESINLLIKKIDEVIGNKQENKG